MLTFSGWAIDSLILRARPGTQKEAALLSRNTEQ